LLREGGEWILEGIGGVGSGLEIGADIAGEGEGFEEAELIGEAVIINAVAAAENEFVADAVGEAGAGGEVACGFGIEKGVGDFRNAGDGVLRGGSLDEAGAGESARRGWRVEAGIEAAVAAEGVDGIAQVIPADAQI